MMMAGVCANVYWLGKLGEEVEKSEVKWEKFVKAQTPEAK